MSLSSIGFEYARALKHAFHDRWMMALAKWRQEQEARSVPGALQSLESRLLMAGDPPIVSLATAEPGVIRLQVQDNDGPGLGFGVFDIANYTLLASGGDGTFGDGNEIDRSDRIAFPFIDTDGFDETIVVLLNVIPNDGERYQLQLNNLADQDGNALVYPTPAEFDAGELANVPQVEGTGTAKDLFQLFTLNAGATGLDEASAESIANYTLLAAGGDFSFGDGNETDRSDLIAGVTLEPNFIDTDTHEIINVSLAGVPDDGEQYMLLVNNVTDQSGNPLLTFFTLEFNAIDVLANQPPIVDFAQGSAGEIELSVSDADNSGLNATLVEDSSNFTLLGSGGDGIFGNGNDVDRSNLITSTFVRNNEGNESIVVDLTCVPDDGETYQLLVSNIADNDGNPRA